MADEEIALPEKPKRKLPATPILIAGINTLLVLTALGMMAYTKLIYQRPMIVEDTELKRQLELAERPAEVGDPNLVSFDQLTMNIAMTSGKVHYATLSFAVQCRDAAVVAAVKAKQALFIDRVIAALGKRQMTELNTIQGKLLLKTELVRQFNEIVSAGDITDMYFSDFVLQ